MMLKGVKKINILNYIDYNKSSAIEELNKNVGWQYYGGKHFESVFTQFFQAYVLPKKFGFDKRRAHLSTLICSDQMTRQQALAELEKPLYDEKLLNEHREYVIKKWELTQEEFETIMNLPPKKHEDYPTNKFWMNIALQIKNKIGI
jgi:hypothetical protein